MWTIYFSLDKLMLVFKKKKIWERILVFNLIVYKIINLRNWHVNYIHTYKIKMCGANHINYFYECL